MQNGAARADQKRLPTPASHTGRIPDRDTAHHRPLRRAEGSGLGERTYPVATRRGQLHWFGYPHTVQVIWQRVRLLFGNWRMGDNPPRTY